MVIELSRDAEEFAGRALPFLEERLERNVLATTLSGVLGGAYDEAIFALGYAEPGEPVGPAQVVTAHPPTPTAAAIRTPPRGMLASGFADRQAATELIRNWLEEDPDLPGLGAEPATAQALTRAWREQTGGTSVISVSEAMHMLTEVIDPPQPPTGHARQATWADEALVEQWARAFAIDAHFGNADEAAYGALRRLELGHVYLWQTELVPTCLVGHAPTIAGTARVGPVYTPPSQRGHGYAGALTAAVSRNLLNADAQRCMLYTDLSNPVSNHVYAKIGYRVFGHWEEHTLIPATG